MNRYEVRCGYRFLNIKTGNRFSNRFSGYRFPFYKPTPDVVEASTGDLVDVVLHGQLAVQVDTEVPDDSVTLDYRPTDLN